MLAIIVAQLFGLNMQSKETNARLKYIQNENATTEEFAVFVFFVYVMIGTFVWPVAGLVSLWRNGYIVWSIIFSIAALTFLLVAFPVYLIWGFIWSVVAFTAKYL